MASYRGCKGIGSGGGIVNSRAPCTADAVVGRCWQRKGTTRADSRYLCKGWRGTAVHRYGHGSGSGTLAGRRCKSVGSSGCIIDGRAPCTINAVVRCCGQAKRGTGADGSYLSKAWRSNGINGYYEYIACCRRTVCAGCIAVHNTLYRISVIEAAAAEACTVAAGRSAVHKPLINRTAATVNGACGKT